MIVSVHARNVFPLTETDGSDHASAAYYRRPENIRVVAVVIPVKTRQRATPGGVSTDWPTLRGRSNGSAQIAARTSSAWLCEEIGPYVTLR